jgi:hypothetical protein
MSEPPLDFYPLFGVSHGAEVPFVMQTASISKPEASLAIVDLQETIGDYWYEKRAVMLANTQS